MKGSYIIVQVCACPHLLLQIFTIDRCKLLETLFADWQGKAALMAGHQAADMAPLTPVMVQQAPDIAPEGLLIAPEGPLIAPEGPLVAPQGPIMAPQAPVNQEVLLLFQPTFACCASCTSARKAAAPFSAYSSYISRS